VSDSFLPPAVLDLIVNAAQWNSVLDEATEPLEAINDLMAEVSGAAGDMGAAMGAGAGEVAAAASESAGAMGAVAESATAMGEAASAAGDAVAAGAERGAESVQALADVQAAAAGDASAAAGAARETAAAYAETGGAADAAAGSVAALGDVQVAAGAKAAETADAEDAAAAKTTAAGDAAAGAGSKWKLWGLAVAAGVAISLHMAGDYQQQMTRLVTSAGETQANLAMVSQGILAMSVATNTSTSQLASGMYQVESAGFHGAAGLQVLKAAAEGAQAEGADLSEVANAVTSGLNAYGLSAQHATSFTNQMITTVGQGKMTMQDLASSLSSVLPIAASYKISFAQVGGALATMTSMGVSARQGAQDLAFAMRSLGNPTSVATNEMSEFGISSTAVSSKLGKLGLTGTISYLSDAVMAKMGPSGMVLVKAMNQSKSAAADATQMLGMLPKSVQSVSKAYLDGGASYTTWYNATKNLPLTAKTMADQFASVAGKAHGFNSLLASGAPAAQTYSAAMAKMLGGATGLNVGLMLTGAHAATFNGKVKAIADSAKGAGSNVKGWGLIQGNFNFQLGSAEKAAQAMAISFGTALLPAATKVMKIFGEFGGWLAKHTAASKALAIIVGVLLAGALEHGLAKALGTCVKGFKDVTGISGKVLGFFKAGEGDASGFSKMLSGIGSGAKAAWSGLQTAGSAISGAFSAVGSGIGSAVTAVKNWGIWSKIASAATKAWTGIQWAFNAAMDAMPIILIVAAIAALVAGIIYAYIHFKTFRDIVNDVGRAIKGAFLDALHAVEKAVDEVVGFVKSHWVLIVGFILGPIALVAALIYTHWNTVKRIFDDAWGYIKALVRRDVQEVASILGWFGSLPGKMRGWWNEAAAAVETAVNKLLGHVRNIEHEVLGAIGDAGHWLWNAGIHIIDGLIGGIGSMIGSLKNKVTGLGNDVVGWAKDALGVFSPSKRFAEIGAQITAGLTLGINSTAQQAVDESRRLAQEVAAAAMSGAITASEEASLRTKLSAALGKALKGGVQDALASGTVAQIGAAHLKMLGAIWDAAAAGDITRPQASALAAWVKQDNARLQALAKQRNTIAAEIAAAKAYASSTASAAESTYSLTAAAGTGTAPASVSSIISTLQGDVGKIRRFATNIKKLAKEGLNKAYLSQIIAMGPDSGGPLAAELAAAGLGQIHAINAAESQVTAASNGLGNAAANAMYDSGAQAGKGFLSGLKAQQAAIEKVMAQIAASMVARLRKDLGISSPSKVFFAHGQAIAQGLALGIASGVGQVARAVGGLSAAASLAGTRSTVPAGALSSAGPGTSVNLHLNIDLEGKVDEGVLFRTTQQETLRYNVRNSGTTTGAMKPGMP